MALGIYAGATVNAMAVLPSPVSVKEAYELIWSENTGRAQSGANQAKMIGDVIAQKKTYSIQWGVISAADLSTITTKLTGGFFKFGMGTSLAAAQAAAVTVYRGTITSNVMPIGNTIYYKDVSCDLIEQ